MFVDFRSRVLFIGPSLFFLLYLLPFNFFRFSLYYLLTYMHFLFCIHLPVYRFIRLFTIILLRHLFSSKYASNDNSKGSGKSADSVPNRNTFLPFRITNRSYQVLNAHSDILTVDIMLLIAHTKFLTAHIKFLIADIKLFITDAKL